MAHRGISKSLRHRLVHLGWVGGGAVVMSALCFLLLPLVQALTATPPDEWVVRRVDTTELPPPPPPEPEQPEEKPQETEPPKLEETPPLPDLDQLELSLGGGVGGSGGFLAGADLQKRLESVARETSESEAMFSLADLDQAPRAIYKPLPPMTAAMRKKAPARVWVLFVVDVDGRVDSPIVQECKDPVFERPALDAVRKWKFEPGKRNGRPVRSKMRVPITFQKNQS